MLWLGLADAAIPQRSLHTGCPTLVGTKWSATKWIHNVPFRPEGLRGSDFNS